jgi:RHS repeat-associated protein
MSFTYNAAGSMLTKVESGATTSYTHDFLQQLVKVVSGSNTYTYSYDGLGRRVKTVDPVAGTSYFMYAGRKMLYSKVGSAESAYVYVGDKLLLRKDASAAQPSYYHQDISPGSVRFVSYFTGSVLTEGKFRYKPFGEMLTLVGATRRFQYAQQESDGARQYHMGARYQDPVVGRFLQRDPIGPGYDYATNNPVSYWDPTGAFWQYVAGVIGGAVVGWVACGLTTGGWVTAECGKAAAVGALAGFVFVATFGLGTAIAGGLGLASGGLAATVVAGAIAGAVSGLASYETDWGIDRARGIDRPFDLGEAAQWTAMGALTGAVTSGIGWGISKGISSTVVRLWGGKSGPLSEDPAGGGWMKATDFLKSFFRTERPGPLGPRHAFGIGEWNEGSQLSIGILRGQVPTRIASSVPVEGLQGGGTEVAAKGSNFIIRFAMRFYYPAGWP